MKRIVALLLAVITVLALFSSCGSKTSAASTVNLKSGETVQLLTEGFPENAEITWTSDNEEVVTVSQDGKVTYVAEGTATVIAKAGDKTKTYNIRCLKDGDTGITFDIVYKNLLADGDTVTVSATLSNESDKIKSWKSSNEAVATVKDGIVTRVGAGRAEITAETAYGYSAVCYVMCDSIIMTLGDIAVTDSMYGYWVASYKTQLVEYNIGTDDESIWTTVIDDESGQTLKEMFDDNVYSSVVQMMKAVEIYKESHPDAENEVDEAVNDQIATAIEMNGGEDKFEQILSHFYVDSSIVKKVFTYEEITNRCYEELFGEGGSDAATEDEIKAYFYDNYTHVKHVFFDLKYAFDDEGNYYELSGDETEEKRLLAGDVLEKITSGKLDFDKAIDEYSDDTEEYKDGFIFADGYPVEEFNDAAFDMDIDEIRLVESSYGLHIMKRIALKDEDIDDTFKAEVKDKIETERFDKYITDKGLTVDADENAVKAKCDVVKTPLFSSFTAE